MSTERDSCEEGRGNDTAEWKISASAVLDKDGVLLNKEVTAAQSAGRYTRNIIFSSSYKQWDILGSADSGLRMSSSRDEKLRSLLGQLSTDANLDLPKTDESNEVDNAIAEENAYTKKRSQEFLLTEMEQKLEIAEINFGTLKHQLDYMKMLYHDIHQEPEKVDKHRKDRHKKRPQAKTKNPGQSLRRRFSSASVHKGRGSTSANFKPLGHKAVTYATSASNTEDSYTATEPQSPKKKSPRNAEIEKAIPSSEMPNKETKSMQELSTESARLSSREKQGRTSSQSVNQEQQTDPLEITKTHNIQEDFWYGFVEDTNETLEHSVELSEQFVAENLEKETGPEAQNDQEVQYSVVVSGNSRSSMNNSGRSSGKQDVYFKRLQLETPRKGAKRPKGKSKRTASQSTILTLPLVECSDTTKKNKRKPKVRGGNTDKRRKSTSKTNIHARQTKPKITETVVSVATKPNKRSSKIKVMAPKSIEPNKKEKKVLSQYRLAEEDLPFAYDEEAHLLKPGKNLVELYHNENINVNISEENVPESPTKSAPKSPKMNPKNRSNSPRKISKKSEGRKWTKAPLEKKESGIVKTNQNDTVQSNEAKIEDDSFPPVVPVEEPEEPLHIPEETKTVDTEGPYEQPKGPSKFKYFKRNYYKRINFKNIPFVAGTSTSPSHNLGLNIQQVLSIIKMKQPRFKDNVTAHTQVLDSSAIIQHTVQSSCKSVCPARMHHMLAEASEEGGQPNDSKADNSTNGVLLGLSDKPRRPEDIWVVDQDEASNKKPKCTCVPSRRCTDYQQLLIEYLEKGGGDISFLSRKYSGATYPHISSAERRFRSHFSTVQSKGVPQEVSGLMSNPWEMEPRTVNDNTKLGIMDLPQPHYNVKTVLSHLHDDFNRLNTHYEQLQNGYSKESLSKEKKLELQKLELQLKEKEDEINMIMNLHKEVSALKQHLKQLRTSNGHSNLEISNSKLATSQYFGKGPTPSLRLTKLLRIMQQFQYRLRQVSDRNSRSLSFYHCFMINIE